MGFLTHVFARGEASSARGKEDNEVGRSDGRTSSSGCSAFAFERYPNYFPRTHYDGVIFEKGAEYTNDFVRELSEPRCQYCNSIVRDDKCKNCGAPR